MLCVFKFYMSISQGKKCKYLFLMFLFMMLVIFKVGGLWDHLESIFKINAVTFQKLIEEFVDVYHKWV